ncbi:MAG: hypothetical protein Q8Q86_00065 [Candidatus Daviesbacteria bacterium]|nr:hypothetical protein [Candidatus Daviesbacteria bacterium]
MARVLLSKKVQYQLCFSAREKLGVNWAGLARYLNVHPHTFDNWYKGHRLLPENIFTKLVNISGSVIKKPKLLPDNWGRVKGGKRSVELHGRSFWTLEGSKKGGTNSAKKVSAPDYSAELAEFIGIMLGDGGVSRGQITVTLGYTTDKEYAPYVIELIYKLFQIKASSYTPNNHNIFRIRASGVNLVKNLLADGLVQGNKVKQQFDIPNWIQQKEEYIRACIRGMIDTDGCVHRKVRREKNGMEYRSIGITFCSLSKPLQISFIRLFNMIGFQVAISGKTIYLCGQEQVKRYLEEIGFSNPKHLNRYYTFLRDYAWVKVPSKIV